MDPAAAVTRLLDAFNDGHPDRMRDLMDPALVAWVTDAEGVAQPVSGADADLDRVAAMNLPVDSDRFQA